MSGPLKITFARDMPVAAVEVVSPDLQVVARTMLSSGRSKTVHVPSEKSFLRIHLPTGEVVTLKEPGSMSRTVSRASLRRLSASGELVAPEIPSAGNGSTVATGSTPGNEGVMRPGPMLKGTGSDASAKPRPTVKITLGSSRKEAAPARAPRPEPVQRGEPLALGDNGAVRLDGPSDTQVVGRSRGRHGQVWTLHGRPADPPGQLEYRSGAFRLRARLPSTLLQVKLDYKPVRNAPGLLDLRLRGSSPAADAILCYIQRGDMYSAQAMEEWIDEAESMVLTDDSDPYSGTVGAYLLLRLRRFDRLREWTREIADRFEFLPDGCVLWAWQLLQTHPDRAREAREYLLRAAARGLPVYTDGLRLLLDGLQMMGEAAAGERERISAEAGDVIWSAPLTTTIALDETDAGGRTGHHGLRVDVRFVGS